MDNKNSLVSKKTITEEVTSVIVFLVAGAGLEPTTFGL